MRRGAIPTLYQPQKLPPDDTLGPSANYRALDYVTLRLEPLFSLSRLATAKTRPLRDSWIAGPNAFRPIFAVLRISQRTGSATIALVTTLGNSLATLAELQNLQRTW